MCIDKSSQNLISLFESNGHKAYAVGGCVRDSLLCREVSDIDIAVSCTPDVTVSVLSQNGVRYVETGIKHGTVTAIVDGKPYEITTFRTDGDYTDNRRPDNVSFVANIEDDLSRRDFTINAMAFNETCGVIDIFGGKEDIENKVIRAVGNPDKRFLEDSLRILRALRFAATLDFEIESNTASAIFKNKHLLCNIARERITAELSKLIVGKAAHKVLYNYFDVFCVILPDLAQISEKHALQKLANSIANALPNVDIRLALILDNIKEKSYKLASLNSLKLKNTSKNLIKFLLDSKNISLTQDRTKLKSQLFTYGVENMLAFFDFRAAFGYDTSSARDIVFDIINKKEPFTLSHLKINGADVAAQGYSGADIKAKLVSMLYSVIRGEVDNLREDLIQYMAFGIRKAKQCDFERICEIYESAREFMRKNDNPDQWGTHHPPIQTIKDDIDDQKSYVCINNDKICGVFVLCKGEDPTYRVIDNGEWLNEEPYIAIHRVASDGSVKRLTDKMLDFTKTFGLDVRGDTHHKNIPMQNVFKRNGFTECGIIYLLDGSPRIAYHFVNK